MMRAPSLDAPELPCGTELGNYRVLRRLAMGGMAELYLVEPCRGEHGARVLKRVHPYLAHDEEFVTMLLKEAKIASTLNHPRIAKILNIGSSEQGPFFVMEYVAGADFRVVLQEVAKRGVPDISLALNVVSALADALDYAHKRRDAQGRPMQIVHRDVSPSNVMIAHGGDIKLVDFGIAAAWAGTRRTQAGVLKGKVGYMSPEQCLGNPVDARSDVFGLGVLLYEASTHRRPFRGDSPYAVMNQIVTGRFDPPSEACPGYLKPLEAVVLRAMATDPEARYPDAKSLGDDLRQVMACVGVLESADVVADRMRDLFDVSRPSITENVRSSAAEPPRIQRSPSDVPGSSRRSLVTPMLLGVAIVAAAAAWSPLRNRPTHVQDDVPSQAPRPALVPPKISAAALVHGPIVEPPASDLDPALQEEPVSAADKPPTDSAEKRTAKRPSTPRRAKPKPRERSSRFKLFPPAFYDGSGK